MESFAQGLAANLFAAPMPPAGSAPAGGGLAGLIGGAFSSDGTKRAKIDEFLGVLDASAPLLDPEQTDLAAAPDSLAVIADRAEAQLADGSSATLVLANTERLIVGAAADDGERIVSLTTEERVGAVQRFVRSGAGLPVETINDANPRTAPPADNPQLSSLVTRVGPRDDGLDLSRRFEPQRFEVQRSEFLAPALPTNKIKAAAPLMTLALTDKATIEPGPIVRDDSIALIQSLSVASERASTALTMAPLSDAATKPAAQIVAAITNRGMDTSIEVRLDPPELGRVTIDFEGRGGDIIRATVAAEAPDTLELMRRNIDILQRELEKSGLANIDLQFREGGSQSDANFSDERFGAGRQQDDALGIEMNDMPHHIAALSLDGRLDRLL
ncbi:Flagellar hook-length control protein FliK [hydrothermal vent metagenome]|uniref:Flagellar hook-length control protein FliK n=1 Tax=hydrothermal vent metagenome TaxID=652676 RepID=A0A3B0SSP8_9ZZZZ